MTVDRDGLSSAGGSDSVIHMPIKATKVMTLSSAKKKFISVEEEWFRSYVTDALRSVHGCYVRQILEDGSASLLGVPTHVFEYYKEEA